MLVPSVSHSLVFCVSLFFFAFTLNKRANFTKSESSNQISLSDVNWKALNTYPTPEAVTTWPDSSYRSPAPGCSRPRWRRSCRARGPRAHRRPGWCSCPRGSPGWREAFKSLHLPRLIKNIIQSNNKRITIYWVFSFFFFHSFFLFFALTQNFTLYLIRFRSDAVLPEITEQIK